MTYEPIRAFDDLQGAAPDPALSVPGICRELGISRASLYRTYINTGRLRTFRVGSGRRASLSAVRELRAALEAEATPQ